MMTTLTLTFEEVPLVREPGLVAGLVGGEAEISVYDEGEWFISAITLDGARDSEPGISLKPVAELDRDSWLFRTIHSELEAHWKDQIEDLIRDAYAEAAE